MILALSLDISGDYFWIMSLVPVVAWGVVGLILAFIVLFRLGDPDHRRAAARQGWSMLAMAVAFLPLSIVGGWLTNRLRFLYERPGYEHVVAAATANPVRGYHDTGTGPSHIIDEGPPVRVAFPWPGGIVDNWCGAVYDPSAEVLKVNALKVGSSEWRASPVTQLFDGDMIWCEHLSGSYYLCCFT
jgi:hypothetical protein